MDDIEDSVARFRQDRDACLDHVCAFFILAKFELFSNDGAGYEKLNVMIKTLKPFVTRLLTLEIECRMDSRCLEQSKMMQQTVPLLHLFALFDWQVCSDIRLVTALRHLISLPTVKWPEIWTELLDVRCARAFGINYEDQGCRTAVLAWTSEDVMQVYWKVFDQLPSTLRNGSILTNLGLPTEKPVQRGSNSNIQDGSDCAKSQNVGSKGPSLAPNPQTSHEKLLRYQIVEKPIATSKKRTFDSMANGHNIPGCSDEIIDLRFPRYLESLYDQSPTQGVQMVQQHQHKDDDQQERRPQPQRQRYDSPTSVKPRHIIRDRVEDADAKSDSTEDEAREVDIVENFDLDDGGVEDDVEDSEADNDETDDHDAEIAHAMVNPSAQDEAGTTSDGTKDGAIADDDENNNSVIDPTTMCKDSDNAVNHDTTTTTTTTATTPKARAKSALHSALAAEEWLFVASGCDSTALSARIREYLSTSLVGREILSSEPSSRISSHPAMTVEGHRQWGRTALSAAIKAEEWLEGETEEEYGGLSERTRMCLGVLERCCLILWPRE